MQFNLIFFTRILTTKIVKKIYLFLSSCEALGIAKIILTISLVFIGNQVFAGSGTDLLNGTDADFWATFNHTGKIYLYAAEGLLALATYIKTRNLLTLTGILVISVFINILLKFAGQ